MHLSDWPISLGMHLSDWQISLGFIAGVFGCIILIALLGSFERWWDETFHGRKK